MTTQQERDRNRRADAAGNRQQQRDSKSNRPWGHGKATIQVSAEKTIFVPVGAVWETAQGNLQLVLDAEPNQWKDPHCRRVVVLLKSEERDTERSR